MQRYCSDFVKVEELLRDMPEMARDSKLLYECAVSLSASSSACSDCVVRGGSARFQQDRFVDSPLRVMSEDLSAIVSAVADCLGEFPAIEAELLRDCYFRGMSTEQAAEDLSLNVRRAWRLKKRWKRKDCVYGQRLVKTVKQLRDVYESWLEWRNKQLEEMME